MKYADPVATAKGVGTAVAAKLQMLGVTTIGDLLEYYPRRYDDYSTVTAIKSLVPGPISIKATVKQITGKYVRRGMHITEAIVADDSGSLRLVWFNQPYRANATKIGQEYFISGVFQMSSGRLSVMNASMELVSSLPVNAARIVPIYRETKGLKSTTIRKIMVNLHDLIKALPETLPQTVIDQSTIQSKSAAIMGMHFPESMEQVELARKRLGFEEIFGLSVASVLNKKAAAAEETHKIIFNEALAKQFVASLPFELTTAQKSVAWQLYQDLQQDMPMNRLVEGDVGSGKTVVAAMAAIMAMHNGYQVAFMAPTELLAQQHAEGLFKLLKPVGMHTEVALLTGSIKLKQRIDLYQAIADGSSKCIVGTHALITDSVDMHKLGLVVIDEQHRFGVEQRKKLQIKANGTMPHVLSMTATPIPRSLALTLYGELDISIIKEKPKNRLPIITEIVSPNSKKPAYSKIDAQLEAGHQAFVVCPLIEKSDKLTALSAEAVYKSFTESTFKHRRVGLLHGKMKADQKEAIMQQFVRHELDILVSTTVIEVGVDVPNATVMVIEGAERFGLAQMHQLRGRVGRGVAQGYCFLIMSDSKEPSRRLKALESSSDGFKLSELDLEIRGPGAIYGASQSGQLDLRVAKLTDVALIESARNAAYAFVESGEDLAQYAELHAHVSKYRSVTNLN